MDLQAQTAWVPAITCSGLSKRYGAGRLALDGVSLDVPAGASLALVGQNGAGKSTLLKLWLGFVRPTGGRLAVLGQERVERAHHRLGYVPERPVPEPGLSGRAWLRHLARIAGLPDPGAAVERVLAEVDLVAAAARRMSSYSRGMLQRVALAQALLGEPELLLLDEPTTGLDPESQWRVRETIRERWRRGTTVVLSSHNLPEVEMLCDRVAVLHRGRLVASSSLVELRSKGPSVEIELAAPVTPERVAALGLAHLGAEAHDGLLVVPVEAQAAALAELLAAGIGIASLNPRRRSLEEALRQVTRT